MQVAPSGFKLHIFPSENFKNRGECDSTAGFPIDYEPNGIPFGPL